MDYMVRSPLNKPDVVEVRYDCDCGCKPRARYQRGIAKAGHDHCCCGQAHFVGQQALHQMEAYLEQRCASGEDVGLNYVITVDEVNAPWGELIPIIVAVPDKLLQH